MKTAIGLDTNAAIRRAHLAVYIKGLFPLFLPFEVPDLDSPPSTLVVEVEQSITHLQV